MELTAKAWSKSLESEMLQRWQREPHPERKGKTLTIDTPPPYPSGRPWHIGAAAHYAQIDMIARASRLLGWNVRFPIGIDRNGVPVEMYTEKKLGISLHTTPREQFVAACRTALDDLEAEMLSIMKTMGLSGDFAHVYRTDSPEYRSRTQATFIDLWKRGLIYEDSRLNNWCPGCMTTVSDNEVGYKEIPTFLNHVEFRVKETGQQITIATTRPELLCTAALVVFNPRDERYHSLEGKTALVPFYNLEIPIISHPIADPAFGSGLMYMSRSAGDLNAVRFLREMGIPYDVCITEEGRMNDKAGPLVGLSVRKARERIRDELRKLGVLAKEEQINHQTPVCERSKHEIEYIAMPEYYLKQVEFLPVLKQYAQEMGFHPEAHRQILLDWIAAVTMDWPISRRRFYATEIPIWYCAACRHPHLPTPGSYVQPWKDTAPFAACTKCGNDRFVGEDRTFDTWMDSSISPLVVTGYFTDKGLHRKLAATVVRPQAKDIIRTWLFYSLLRCHQLTGKRAFARAWIMGYGVDEKGEKMSKSKGNVIDPIPILEKYGADQFRFWCAQETSLGSDFRCSEDRIVGAGKFLTKLWNTVRFIAPFQSKEPAAVRPLDQWILNELASLVKQCKAGYDDLNFFVPATAIRTFLWNVFAPHYLELAKVRAYRGDAAAIQTLHTCLRALLQLLSPITPFITDYLHRELYGSPVTGQPFPKPPAARKLPFTTDQLLQLDSMIWKAKKDRGLSLKAPVALLTVPAAFASIEQELVETHGVQQVARGEPAVQLA